MSFVVNIHSLRLW